MKVVVDVGANKGDFCLPLARLNPTVGFIAVEPIPSLARELELTKAKENLINLKIVECAIASESGQANFNISNEFDQGTSSLAKFSETSLKDIYWNSRSDTKFDEICVVETKTMEEILDDYFEELLSDQIRSVDFVKIDVQGYDLVALESFGKYLQIVKRGVLESSGVVNDKLYVPGNDLTETLFALNQSKFSISKIIPNDPVFKEYNVFFEGNAESFQDEGYQIIGIDEVLISVCNMASKTELESLRESFEGSISWKITRPLRRGKDIYLKLGESFQRSQY